MRVQRVVLPEDQGVSWTVLGARARADPADRIVVVAPEQCWSVANTQKAYATDLKDYFQFLDQQQIDWRAPSLEVIGE